MPEVDLEAKLRDIFAVNASRVLFLKASPDLEYSHISHAIDLINFEGLPFELTETLLDRAFESCFVSSSMDD